MSEKPTTHAELLLLCGKVRDDALSPEEAARLDELLQASDQAKALYVEYMSIVSLLESRGAVGREAHEPTNAVEHDVFAELLQLERNAEAELVHQVGQLQHKEKQPLRVGGALRWALDKPAVWGGIAALLALAVVLTAVLVGEPKPDPIAGPPSDPSPNEPIKPHVATLTAERDAVWASPQAERALARGSKLKAGQRLTLTQGFAEITTSRGAVAILEAPATIELTDNDNAIRLHSGKLVGLCHSERSKGFVVQTDHADIVDLGTEFAIEARPDGVDTTVFIGKVELNTPDGAVQPITTNQTARLTIDNGKRMIAFEDKPANGFTRRIPRAPLITNATISLPGFKAEVVPQGVYEDAELFSDRVHELNGIDAAGIPTVLLGGDLIRMPADARPEVTPEVGDKLQLEIELTEWSDIYVLVKQDAQVGAWLTRDYTRTGLTAGIDLVGVLTNDPRDYGHGVGPGNSVELTYDVWQRNQPASGKTVVAGSIKRSMYSVVVVPRRDATPLE